MESETFAQYRSGDDLLWNIVKDFTLVNISGGKKPIVTPIEPVVQSSPLQTKSGAWNTIMEVDNDSLRVAEVQRIKKHPHFKTVAVTADQWMPMVEVKLEKSGTTCYRRNKSLILIGKEREGIPGDLLAELDFCVEIKQVGIVRSMNIQTATAIIVHAYSSQHC
ncbi:hypothetical protein Cantr_07363 [Candida viswanathii]|uniref:tRNA/rRNA methyltransferase SpoU type domain-containing protein n=1 Tax=Candida viswanathii TaxID=5486 RepID=A0A367Y1T3_9ASCO|nr:hypothetical protein Cantr_07363 [Candida viswanathii]